MKTIKPFALSAALLLGGTLAACSNASSAETPAQDMAATATAPVGNWDIVADGSFIRFTAIQEGDPFTGQFGAFSGVIDFDPDAPEAGYVRIEIPLTEIDAGSKDRNSTLPSKVWLSAKAHPVAVFESDSITASDTGYVAQGNLTMKSRSVPVTLPFDLVVEGDRAVMTGQVEIDRTRWDIGAAPWDTDEWVSRAVGVDIQVTANRR